MEKGNFEINANGQAMFVYDENGKWELSTDNGVYVYQKIKDEIDPLFEKDLKRVYVTQDQDSHWYIIPAEMLEVYNRLMEKAYSEDDFEEFIEKFGKYATGGDINLMELYARI